MKHESQMLDLVRRLVDGINVPLLLVDPTTNQIEYVNPAFEELSANSSKKLVHSNMYDLFAPSSHERIRAVCEVMRESTSTRLEEYECELVRRSGRRMPVNLVASPMKMLRQNLLLLSVHDLSYIKKLQLQRELSLQEMAQISKLADIGMLAAGVAHELNNPLMIVQGFAENLEMLLNRPEIKREELRRQAKQIQSATERMSRIIKQMSRMVRSSEVQMSLVQVRDFVQNVLQFIQYKVKQSQVQISVELPENCAVKCDQSKVEQVILNIVSNAIHALESCPEETREIRVRCQISKWIDIEIWNNGPPIPKEVQDKVMTPFFTTKDVGKGTGLGLPVSVGIMKAHGGSLRFASHAQEGTTFTLRFPPVASNELARETKQSDMVLLVNVDGLILEKQSEIAGRMNFQALKAQCEMDAYQWLQGNFDLKAVFLNMDGSTLDGLSLVQHVQIGRAHV